MIDARIYRKEETLTEMIPVLEQLKQENNRLHHLTTVLIEHIWKKYPFPLKEIDEKMLEYDKGNV